MAYNDFAAQAQGAAAQMGIAFDHQWLPFTGTRHFR